MAIIFVRADSKSFFKQQLCRIRQSERSNIFNNFRQILSGQVFCHRQIHIQTISAISRRCSRNLSLKVTNKFKHLLNQRQNIFGTVVSRQKQVKPRPAAHWTKINRLFRKFGMIAQKGCAEMFYRMYLCCIHNRLIIRTGHSYVKCCNKFRSELVLPRNIKTRNKFKMINHKTRNFFHNKPPVLSNIPK